MIYEMTPEQDAKVPVYLQKWLDAGYRTRTTDEMKATEAIEFFYEVAGAKKPEHIIFLDSPMACQLAANLIKGTKFESSELRSKLYSELGSKLDSELDSKLYSELGSKLDSELGSKLRSKLDSELGSKLDSASLEYFQAAWSANLWYWVNYYGFYDFVLHELMPEKVSQFELFEKYLKHFQEVHYFLMFDGLCLVSNYPKHIKLNDEGSLHSWDSAALEYRDDWGIFFSNGISMKPEYILTPANEITKEMLLGETNADVSREIIRKMGMARVTEVLQPRVLDTLETETGGKYELMMINYDNRGERPYIKMNCSSSGEVFILGSKPDTKTADEAWSGLNNGYKRENVRVIWEA